MDKVLQVLLNLPTGVFTAALVFCLSWWISSFLLGGMDHGHSGHAGHAGHSGHAGHHAGDHTALAGRAAGTGRAPGAARTGRTGRAGSRKAGRRSSTNTAVPVSLRWTVSAATAWAVVLFGSTIVAASDLHGSSKVAVLIVISLAGIVVGQRSSRGFARLVGPIFITPEAPERSMLVGSHARVRSLTITSHSGEAKVIDGRSAGAIVRVRIVEPQTEFQHGDIVQLISFDSDADVYLIDHAEPDLV